MLELVELGPQFELKSIFQTNNVNSINVRDFIITPDAFVLVGGVRTFLPTALTRETISFEKIIEQNVWADSFWERSEDHENATVLVIRKDGTLLADRVFPDLLNRSISDVVEITDNSFLAVGSAFGDRGWVISFSLREPGSNVLDHLGAWLNKIWVSFYGRH